MDMTIDNHRKELEDLIDKRHFARLDKDWNKSDELKVKIEELGYELRDTDDGMLLIDRPYKRFKKF